MAGEKWIDLPATDLLKEFGKGKCVPGSGSAAALQGLLSARLLQTVIKITLKKEEYAGWHSHFTEIQSKIENTSLPNLERLLQEDSDHFNSVIKLKNDVKNAVDSETKSQNNNKLIAAQRTATKLPIEIAKLCKELAEFALIAFDHGYKTVRGDSGVALNCAISVVGGCLSIIDLNLGDFVNDTWTLKTRQDANELRAGFLELKTESQTRQDTSKQEAEQKISINSYHRDLQPFLWPAWPNSKVSYPQIEKIVRQLQNAFWEHRHIIWKDDTPQSLMEILKPEKILSVLGYEFQQHTSLGQHTSNGVVFEIAGLIDKQKKVVAISKKFKPDIINFTAAHELGHALLHKQTMLHRDKALDGSDESGYRNETERQADKFAALFLMPRKLVEDVFEELFKTKRFKPNQNNVFALTQGRLMDFKSLCKDLDGLVGYMASASYYDGRNFKSLAEIFNVSPGAMAIRLKELELAEF